MTGWWWWGISTTFRERGAPIGLTDRHFECCGDMMMCKQGFFNIIPYSHMHTHYDDDGGGGGTKKEKHTN